MFRPVVAVEVRNHSNGYSAVILVVAHAAGMHDGSSDWDAMK